MSRIHLGDVEMYEIIHQATYRFFGIEEVYKLMMDEMYETGRFIAQMKQLQQPFFRLTVRMF